MADDPAIHGTRLIAAAFCMDRHADGPATRTPTEGAVCDRIGVGLGSRGHLHAVQPEPQGAAAV